ncbi:MAG TPA: DUF2203 domain-containing protein [Bryobacteraceae bacterium]|nr:DUF2203 domain-containing protein [Bryobacteraceae bacterium]
MPRYFTLAQAEKLLPQVESAIRDAVARKAAFDAVESEWQDFARRVMVTGGMQLDRAQMLQQKARRESAALGVKQAIERVHEFGCLVKDLDSGLVDFPTLFNGQEVYLCWKLGEKGIQFWHGVQEGFRGRKAIDAEFLEHHQGELPN